MKKSLKVFIACCLGAGIGTLTAIEVNGIFWWIGMLVGAFVGYISYEFVAVLRAFKNAWRAVTSIRISKDFGRELLHHLRYVALSFVGMVSLLASYGVMVMALYFLRDKAIFFALYAFSVAGGTFMLLMCLVGFVTVVCIGDEGDDDGSFHPFIRYNLFYIYLWLVPKYTFRFVKWLIINTPKLIPSLIKVFITIGRFIKHVFIEIHSDERLLCGIDAAIGTAIGYLAKGVIIGAIVGGVFGVFNYEIISKRVLRIVPIKVK